MTTVEFPLVPDAAPVRFRFTIPTTRQLEKAAGVGIDYLRIRGQQVEALVLMCCYALRSENKGMTEEKAADLIQHYIEAGGDVVKLSEALVEAMNASGVYGKKPEPVATDNGLGPSGPDPTTTVQ